ncbi:hypothetical protein UT300003_26200 [Clostridium sardiniense]
MKKFIKEYLYFIISILSLLFFKIPIIGILLGMVSLYSLRKNKVSNNVIKYIQIFFSILGIFLSFYTFISIIILAASSAIK